MSRLTEIADDTEAAYRECERLLDGDDLRMAGYMLRDADLLRKADAAIEALWSSHLLDKDGPYALCPFCQRYNEYKQAEQAGEGG